MSERIVIVGPGRVGAAFGRRLSEAGHDLLGFVGRRPGRAAEALAFAAAGRELPIEAVGEASLVCFAVGDADLEAAIASAAAASEPKGGSLWLHTSGCHDLAVFAALRGRGVAAASMHPVAPFPDAEQGYRGMRDQPAVIDGPADVLPRIERLATDLGMRPLRGGGGDRALYHAACALAANGLVALRGYVDELFTASEGLRPEDAAFVAGTLMRSALARTSEVGPVDSLSGPVRRGDARTVRRHVEAIAAAAPAVSVTYRVLMTGALALARRAGLDDEAGRRIEEALGGVDGGN